MTTAHLLSVPGRALAVFFFNDPATTEIYTLSLHDALPILPAVDKPPIALNRSEVWALTAFLESLGGTVDDSRKAVSAQDRKSTRLNSSHLVISYAVFCLKKKKQTALSTVHHAHASRSPRHS